MEQRAKRKRKLKYTREEWIASANENRERNLTTAEVNTEGVKKELLILLIKNNSQIHHVIFCG